MVWYGVFLSDISGWINMMCRNVAQEDARTSQHAGDTDSSESPLALREPWSALASLGMVGFSEQFQHQSNMCVCVSENWGYPQIAHVTYFYIILL